MEVKGESYRQSDLLDIVGGRGQYGCTVHTTAHLGVPDDIPGLPGAVSVMIVGKLVGYLPSAVGDQIRVELAGLPGGGSRSDLQGCCRGWLGSNGLSSTSSEPRR